MWGTLLSAFRASHYLSFFLCASLRTDQGIKSSIAVGQTLTSSSSGVGHLAGRLYDAWVEPYVWVSPLLFLLQENIIVMGAEQGLTLGLLWSIDRRCPG